MTATAVVPAAAPVAAIASATCPSSSIYIAHDAADVSAVNAKGRATYAIVTCPTCLTTQEAGVWYNDRNVSPDAPLRDTRGLTYLPRHAAPVLGPVAPPADDVTV